jgi:FAD/FMN-containing dehydrogenase
LLPPVSPELKHITIGGATVGIGIESTCFRHGFVHDALLEADVLLPNGSVVTCTPDNECRDLFFALPNSYGTLGYILRAKLRLEPAKPFVELAITRFDDANRYRDARRH